MSSTENGNNNKNPTSPSVVPKWIEEKLFENTLKELDSEFVKIEEFKIAPALSPGENYASVMLKVDIVIKLNDGSSKPINFMLKVAQDSDVFRQMLERYNPFIVEKDMYCDVVPELENIYKEAGINVQFGAKSFTLPTTEPYILMENLKVQGFHNANRLEGLDMKHAKLVLKKLAQWHAASAVRVVRKGKYSDKYKYGYLRPECYDMVKGMFNASSTILQESIRKYSNADIYMEKVEKMQTHIADEVFKIVAKFDGEDNDDDGVFKVLNHGDAWCNNIMFKYDEETNELLDTYFVDYQIPCYNSPTLDLWYFILSSCTYEIKLKEFDYMISYYHKHLEDNLKLLKYPKKIPSLKDIHYMLYENGTWAYNTITNVMCAVLCDPTDGASMDNFISDSEDGLAFKRQLFSNPRYRKHMEAILPWLLNRGLLECATKLKNGGEIPSVVENTALYYPLSILKNMQTVVAEKMSASNDDTNQTAASVVPKWIEASLFEGALKKAESQFKTIKEFKIGPALAPGENYVSIMLRADFVIQLNDDTEKPVSFMLKVCPESELFREMLEGHNVFDIEAGMYRDTIPEIEEILANAGIEVRFGAKTYSLPIDIPHILLENLKMEGFRNTNRLEGLDMVHIKSVLRKLALWHAATAMRVATKGIYEDKYATGYMKPESYEMTKSMFSNATNVLLESIREFSNSDMYYDQVVKLQNGITDELYKVVGVGAKNCDDEFKVLNHGDAWSNNIMFKYDEISGDLKETYFVDYQIPTYSSPAQDLWYFIMSSCKYEIRLQEFDYMIAYYHKHLEETLKTLKYPKTIPSLKDIHCMLYKNGIWAYATVTNVMAAVLCDPTNNANLDNFISETDEGLAFKKQMYSNPRYRKHMEAILPWLFNRGLLECSL
ncbi:uncharacterized protein LOC142222522 [Haematobia irritans]|uniref:uncharacterized protein LOC142222522 n=1 Tax=Haematobia irritans TaxID=7368 RepID=UPI003F508A82